MDQKKPSSLYYYIIYFLTSSPTAPTFFGVKRKLLTYTRILTEWILSAYSEWYDACKIISPFINKHFNCTE